MATSSEIRAQLGHPVIDADGHVLEYLPAVEPSPSGGARAGGVRAVPGAVEPVASHHGRRQRTGGLSPAHRRARGGARRPAMSAISRTAAAPALMYERMDELGLDYAVLYPTKGFGIAGIADDDLRAGVCRGFNEFYASTYGPYADRLTTAGVVPMHTPTEAMEALRHCADLGLKVVGFPEGVTRPIPEPELEGGSPFLMPGQRYWFDTLRPRQRVRL